MKRAVMRFGDSAAREELGYLILMDIVPKDHGWTGWGHKNMLHEFEFHLPSGKRWHSYGKSPFLMGKSTINGNFQ